MTKNTVKRADITLPLLIEYVDALLPSLTTQTEQSPEHNKDNSEADIYDKKIFTPTG